MAWTEQCKIAFHANAVGKLAKYKNKNRKVKPVLKELSKDSGIPLTTLKRWFYELENSIRTNNGPDNPENNDSNEPEEIPICFLCEINPVFTRRNGKPLSEDSKYFGLCGGCRTNQQYIEKIDRHATQNKIGSLTVCPHCSKSHYVNTDGVYHSKTRTRKPKRQGR
jgi:hypothetical protein